uniref:Abnormal cell migration protein 18-like fibronectin type I domain-containing protein n=1 Tax=Wuchereria bancrofti TaxID=6293 RepID=A0A1I8EW57_WUCBA
MESVLLIVLFLINPLNGCIHDGNTYKDGDTWVEKDAFIMQCRTKDDGAWMVEITACKTPSGETIALNSSLVDGNYEWKCSKNEDGQIVMQKTLNENAKCDEHERGEQWRETSFLFECGAGGQKKLIACFGQNNEQINVGESKEIGEFIVKCENFSNGTVMIHGVRKGTENATTSEVECIDSKGEHHAAGSWWIDDQQYNKTCSSSGKTEVLNCIAKDGTKIPLNEEVNVGDTKYKYLLNNLKYITK